MLYVRFELRLTLFYRINSLPDFIGRRLNCTRRGFSRRRLYYRNRFFFSRFRLLLPSRYWPPDSFKIAVQQSLLASRQLSQQYAELLKNFVLNDSRLLDPRLPANANNWIGIKDEARDLLIQWLSTEDIQLFFDHVLPKRNDPHGRKPFWLKYKDRVKRSRPILSDDDATQWRANTVTKGKSNYGRMVDNCQTSAFLLDFGSVMVVEFSKYGNAVYVYMSRDIPELVNDFWSNSRFPISKLKQSEKCKYSISHTRQWESKMKTLLAQYGIHPGVIAKPTEQDHSARTSLGLYRTGG